MEHGEQTTTGAVPERCISAAEAADALGVSLLHVQRLVVAGVIPSLRLGTRTLIPVSEFNRMIAERTTRKPHSDAELLARGRANEEERQERAATV